MSTFISMLRGINVSGQKKMPMEELRSLYEALGLANVTTYVQSGNVVFDSPAQSPLALARQLEAQIQHSFEYSVPVFIRSTDDFRRVIASNPFLAASSEDPASLHVTFLYKAPSETQAGKLTAPDGIRDEFSIGVQEVFLYCPHGYGRTKLNNSFFERKLNIPATTRNWKTVNALYQIASER